MLVLLAPGLWIFGGKWVDATTAGLIVVSLMLVLGIVTWDDMLANKLAWNTLVWFATLVALADGLGRTGFVAWFAKALAGQLGGIAPFTAMIVLVLVFFFTHYMFASITAHTTAMLPVILAAGAAIPGMPVLRLSMLLVVTPGIMGILTPYATGPSPVYYGSGYISGRDFWRLGAIFGAIYIAATLLIGVPWTAMVQ